MANPEPLAETLPPVLPFDLELPPEAFRALVADVAERMQAPAYYPAAAAVLCLAGVASRRTVVQPKARDASWVVVPNLWGGITAPPGFMKSPVMAAMVRPLLDIQADWRQQYKEELADYEREKEEYELRRAAWQDQFKAAAKKGHGAPERPEDAPEEPTLRRLIINDATFEALHQTMSENPAGVLVIHAACGPTSWMHWKMDHRTTGWCSGFRCWFGRILHPTGATWTGRRMPPARSGHSGCSVR